MIPSSLSEEYAGRVMSAEVRTRSSHGRWSDWAPVDLDGVVNPTALLLEITGLETITFDFDDGHKWQYRRVGGDDGSST